MISNPISSILPFGMLFWIHFTYKYKSHFIIWLHWSFITWEKCWLNEFHLRNHLLNCCSQSIQTEHILARYQRLATSNLCFGFLDIGMDVFNFRSLRLNRRIEVNKKKQPKQWIIIFFCEYFKTVAYKLRNSLLVKDELYFSLNLHFEIDARLWGKWYNIIIQRLMLS